MTMISGHRIAIESAGNHASLLQAVQAGGGQLSELAEAEGLIWDQNYDVERLRSVLSQGPQIRWIQLAWAGVEPFAAAKILDPRYVWTCGKGVYANPVAEHALALALAGLRDLKQRAMAQSWGSQSGTSLLNGRVTILGAGGITQELIRLLQPFHCEITVVRRHLEPLAGASIVTLDQRSQALAGVDVVFLALALTPETKGVISKQELELMGSQTYLVNVARGAHIVTDDLVSALQNQVIRGAALDVTDPEPLPTDHPLWVLPNCLITPHTAGTDAMLIPLLAARVSDNVRRFKAGDPLIGEVDPVLGY